jgi:Lrp/AsnC family leucine-responsive transcriptional regulator
MRQQLDPDQRQCLSAAGDQAVARPGAGPGLPAGPLGKLGQAKGWEQLNSFQVEGPSWSRYMIELDEKAWRLIQALQADGRQPLKSLAAIAGLSVPATAERVKRLEEAGILRGVHAEVSPPAIGYGVQAIVGINAPQPGKRKLIDKLSQMPEVLECLHVSGADSYLMTVVAVDILHLEELISSINMFGETHTSIVFSAPIVRRGLSKPGLTRRPARVNR